VTAFAYGNEITVVMIIKDNKIIGIVRAIGMFSILFLLPPPEANDTIDTPNIGTRPNNFACADSTIV
jgi:hypothetical protein